MMEKTKAYSYVVGLLYLLAASRIAANDCAWLTLKSAA